MGNDTSAIRKAHGGGKLNSPFVQQTYPFEEERALFEYTEESSINGRLGTSGYDGLSDKDKEYVDNLDKAIAKSGWNKTATNTNVRRGGGAICVGVDKSLDFSGDPQGLADYINNEVVGKKYGYNAGFTSMTQSLGVAQSFADGQKNPIIIHYDLIEKGTKAAYVSGGGGKKAISAFGSGEDESLAQRNLYTYANRAWVEQDGYCHVSVNVYTHEV